MPSSGSTQFPEDDSVLVCELQENFAVGPQLLTMVTDDESAFLHRATDLSGNEVIAMPEDVEFDLVEVSC